MNSNPESHIDFSNPVVRDYMSLVRYYCTFSGGYRSDQALICRDQSTSAHPTIPIDKYCDRSSVLFCSSPLPWSVIPFILSSPRSALLNTGDVTRLHPASISPSPRAIAAYIFAIYLGQVGYCILLVLARKPETKVRCCDLQCLLLTDDTEHHNQRCRSRSCNCKLGHGILGYCMGKWV
jgi:hypothetical protein